MGGSQLVVRHTVPIGGEPPEGFTWGFVHPFDDANVYEVPVERVATLIVDSGS